MKIRGNVVSTNMKRPDFHQTNERKSDYIKNNPLPIITPEDEGKMLVIEGEKLVPKDVLGALQVYMEETRGELEAIHGEIEAALGAYITDIDALIGGDA